MIKIIGGAGFVGSHLQDILNSDFQVLDKIIKKNTTINGFDFCDITQEETLKNYIYSEDYVVLLAAEHKDNVKPISKYYETNVQGTKNVLKIMDEVGCQKLIFTSSVAIYGLNKINPKEEFIPDPFNHYGKSKLEAEKIIHEWYMKNPDGKHVTIVRPTVIFGEKNRGNVYNLLNQICSGRFAVIGNGSNKKSMAYVGNVVNFIDYTINNSKPSYEVYNYTDTPDLSMNELVSFVQNELSLKLPSIKIPVLLGDFFAMILDLISIIFRVEFPVSYVRVKKFIATTQFDSSKIRSSKWKAPFSLKKGLKRTIKYEFIDERSDSDKVFYTE